MACCHACATLALVFLFLSSFLACLAFSGENWVDARCGIFWAPLAQMVLVCLVLAQIARVVLASDPHCRRALLLAAATTSHDRIAAGCSACCGDGGCVEVVVGLPLTCRGASGPRARGLAFHSAQQPTDHLYGFCEVACSSCGLQLHLESGLDEVAEVSHDVRVDRGDDRVVVATASRSLLAHVVQVLRIGGGSHQKLQWCWR